MRSWLRKPWVRAAGWAVGAALLAAAVWFAARGVSWDVMREVSWRVWVGMAAAVAGNLVVSATLFWLVTMVFPTRRPVEWRVMLWLIAGSAMLNYLPAVRAGLVGRAAYLKHGYGLKWRDSGWSLLIVMGVTLFVFAAVALPLMVGGVYEVNGAWVCVGVSAALLMGALACWGGTAVMSGAYMNKVAYPREHPHQGLAWVPLRVIDLLLAASRLWLAFAALGSPIGFGEAVVMSAASLLVKLIGLTPNGLGLSEWAVAALSAALTPVEAGTAAAAALLDRAVEVAVVVPTGLGAIAWLRSGLHAPPTPSPAS